MPIREAYAFTNTAMRQVLPDMVAFRQDAAVLDDFMFMASQASFSGTGIIGLASKKVGSARTISQATVSKAAILAANMIGDANQFAAARFIKASLTQYTGPTYDASGDFSLIVLFKATTDSVVQGLVSIFTSSTDRFDLEIASAAGFLAGRCGASSVFAAYVTGAWNLAIIAKKAGTFRVWVNGVTSAVTAHNNAVSNAPLKIGCITTDNACFDGYLLNVIPVAKDVLDDENLMFLLNRWRTRRLGF